MCLDMSFAFSNIPEGYKGEVVKLGDLATIEKKKPHDFSSAMREAMTDADTYTVTFVDPGLTPQQKACIIATVIQLDYMFFENGACTLSDTPGPLRAQAAVDGADRLALPRVAMHRQRHVLLQPLRPVAHHHSLRVCVRAPYAPAAVATRPSPIR